MRFLRGAWAAWKWMVMYMRGELDDEGRAE